MDLACASGCYRLTFELECRCNRRCSTLLPLSCGLLSRSLPNLEIASVCASWTLRSNAYKRGCLSSVESECQVIPTLFADGEDT